MRRAADGSARDDEFVDLAVDLAIDIVRLERRRNDLQRNASISHHG
jgi:hypothetical protein